MDPLIAMIVQFGGNFAPVGWALCNGQLLNISQNSALFSILGTTYGGNGTTTFALPDFRGRAPIAPGQGNGLSPYALGQMGGTETVTLTQAQMPAHTHATTSNFSSSTFNAQTAKASTQIPASGSFLGQTKDSTGTAVPQIYVPAGATTATVPLGGLNVAGTVTNALAGGSQPFSIIQPYLAVTFIIAVNGIYPSRN